MPPGRRRTRRSERTAQNADVSELVLADHGRIDRLFAALDDISRYNSEHFAVQPVGQAWTRISDLVLAHADAEEKILPALIRRLGRQREEDVAGTARIVASLAKLRAAVARAGLHEVGSPGWWLNVQATRLASAEHNHAVGLGLRAGPAQRE